MHFLLGEKWAYDPHKVIYNKIIENGYSSFVHDSKPKMEKLANKGFVGSGNTSIKTPIISEKESKINKEKAIDYEDEEHRTEKRTKLSEEMPNTAWFLNSIRRYSKCTSFAIKT